MIIRARHICPSSASQSSENTHASHELGQRAVWSVGQAIPQEDQCESWTRADGDKDLEDGSFGVAIANRCADGGEPFDGISKVLVLDNLVVMEGHSNDQRAEEGSICGDGMQVRDKLSRNLEKARVRGVNGGGTRESLTTATTSPSRCLGGILKERKLPTAGG